MLDRGGQYMFLFLITKDSFFRRWHRVHDKHQANESHNGGLKKGGRHVRFEVGGHALPLVSMYAGKRVPISTFSNCASTYTFTKPELHLSQIHGAKTQLSALIHTGHARHPQLAWGSTNCHPNFIMQWASHTFTI